MFCGPTGLRVGRKGVGLGIDQPTQRLSPRRRRIWQICAYVMGLCIVLRADIYANYLVVVGFYIYALWRASKVEGRSPNSFAARQIAKAEAKAQAKAEAEGDPDPS